MLTCLWVPRESINIQMDKYPTCASVRRRLPTTGSLAMLGCQRQASKCVQRWTFSFSSWKRHVYSNVKIRDMKQNLGASTNQGGGTMSSSAPQISLTWVHFRAKKKTILLFVWICTWQLSITLSGAGRRAIHLDPLAVLQVERFHFWIMDSSFQIEEKLHSHGISFSQRVSDSAYFHI